MPFVTRDSRNRITSTHERPSDGAAEELADDDPELAAYVTHQERLARAQALFADLDADMVRVIEDLIDLLVKKHILLPTDLPVAVQKKLMGRQQLRQKISGTGIVIGEQDVI